MANNQRGRPSKFEPWMCERVVELMKEGASKTEVAASIGIDRDTLNEWSKTNSDFSVSIKKGEQLSEVWWEKIARENLITHPKGPQFNSTLWYMNMKNRFGWKDKQEVEHSGNKDKPIQHNHDFKKMTDDDLNQFLDQAKKG